MFYLFDMKTILDYNTIDKGNDICYHSQSKNNVLRSVLPMESFAFWYKQCENRSGETAGAPDGAQEVTATMNFNLWCQCGWKTEPYLDIGFKIQNLKNAETLFFFLPFVIREEEKTKCIEDLGCKFSHTELVDAVFNESYATTIAANKKTIKVETANEPRSGDKRERFYIYQLDIEHDMHLESFADGTIISINTANITNSVSGENAVYYLRFRICHHDLGFLIHKYDAPSRALQSLFNTTYMIDFRFHNVRSLHKTLIERFNQENTKVVAVTSLHFLLMTKAYIDVDINNIGFKGIRKIEKDVWGDYVNQNGTEDLLAYHIAQKPKEGITGKENYLNSSELFAKFRVERSVLWWYLLFTIGLGALGSVIATLFLQPILEDVWKFVSETLVKLIT